MAPKPCLGTPGTRCPELTTHPTSRCKRCRSKHQSQRDIERGSPAARGYGREHQELRDQWASRVAAGVVHCHHPDCGQLIRPGEPWDLGHTIDRGASGGPVYRGPEHQACNRATRGPLRQQPKPPPTRRSPLDTI